ncbi:MAG TPA: beta-galactosidase [Pseudothermotoga sp.]|nr:beta-galactosidase [Pseudothermotoga sp.]
MFGKDFLFGVSISGFQFEMGDEKSIDPNTDWFAWIHDELNQLNYVVSEDCVENGVNYWSRYEEIHKLCEECGLNSIRIGIEWSRIFPRPTFDTRSDQLQSIADMKAVEHYREIVTDARKKGLRVILNLNHFTLPIWLHDPIYVNRNCDFSKNGWINDKSVEEFSKYAEFCVKCFDDLCDMYSTMNEPNIVAQLGYLSRNSGFPPSIMSVEFYKKAIENQIKAHKSANNKMKQLTEKPVGIIYATIWYEGDESAEEAMKFANWYFLDEAMKYSDFLGANYYTRAVVKKRKPCELNGLKITWKTVRGFGQSCKQNSRSFDGHLTTDNGWEIYPEGLEKILIACWQKYKKPIYITENGVADIKDIYRPYYIVSHLSVIEKLIENGLDIKGYLHWSITDNFEWALGYSMRFGLIHVDFADGSLTPRPSYFLYSKIIEKNTAHTFKKLLEIWG